MSFFRRASKAPAAQIVDAALDDEELRAARDVVVSSGDWRPAAELMERTRGNWDRRTHVASTLAAAAEADLSWADRWLEEAGSQAAYLVRGWAGIERAWAVRGRARAKDTSLEAFKGFHAWLDDTAPLLLAAARGDDADPAPWVAMQWVAVGLQWDRESFDKVWAEYKARDPRGRAGYVPALQYLCKKWHGSHEDMYALVADAPPTGWAVVLPLEAHFEFLVQQLSSKEMGVLEFAGFWEDASRTRDLDLALGWARRRPTHPLALRDLSLVAYTAMQADRWADAAEVFAICGHRAADYPWRYFGDPVGELAKAHRKVMKRAGSRFWAMD